MNGKATKSIKIDYRKRFAILWIIAAAISAVVMVVLCVRYVHYKNGQNAAVEFTMAATSQFDQYEADRKTLIKEMYEYLNPPSYYMDFTGHGGEVRAAIRKVDLTLSDMLSKHGYDCSRGSDYLEYTNFFEYITHRDNASNHDNRLMLKLVGSMAAVLIVANLLYVFDRSNEMTVTDDSVICKRGKKTIKQFMIKDIRSVESAGKNNIRVKGRGIRYRINKIKNAEEIKAAIMEKRAIVADAGDKNKPKGSAAEAIMEYKKLLDAGIISQEEFSAKRAQLLDL